MKLFIIATVFFLMAGCVQNACVQDSVEIITQEKDFLPQLWSDHKKLDISESVCADKGKQILNSLGFTRIVKSSHGEYIYGNYSNNRAAIKCISINGQTVVYSIFAGPKKAVVEKLRNAIMWQY